MKIVGAVFRGGLMTLCLDDLVTGTAHYRIFVVADFVIIFN